ncbi:MAG: glycine--tRNA ligase subunit beta [Brevundimonas sp.]|uniref:glycine--tRNA ligase subunit beta n=1 Tax=Brevundimonas sp. TaxID=1871086 RepID=UPI0039195BC5
MPQLLLEILSEEIPARMQAGAARDLERMMAERLKAAGLSWDSLVTHAGPRRLTLVIEGLPTATPERNEELKGPRVGAPEQAMEGFLRKTGVAREQLVERDGVFFATINAPGRASADVVAETLDHVIRNFPWPKSMRWGTGTLRWVRPIRRILCLLDGQVVPFAIEGIEAHDATEGHRFMGTGRPLKIRSFDDYLRQLRDNAVLVDAEERRARILEQARAVCAARGLELVEDEGLLDEVTGLAEWPTPILGDMDPQFLDLPPEVVRLSMKVHQKYFAVRDPATGRLAPHFVVVANVEASDGGRALAQGNARVLSARLNDARFFWDEDRKVGFDAWLKKLSGVTFHARLGTMAERVERIAALAREIAPLVGADPDQAEQAARLAKADLASGMVGEFPELQGIMGGYYARAQYGDAIADAIRDHYRPQGPSDTVPSKPLTVAVALADKLDTLVGFFAIDEKPTGSKDPFALRRAALGVIRLILDNGLRLGVQGWAYVTGEYLSGVRRHAKLSNYESAGRVREIVLKGETEPDRLRLTAQLAASETEAEWGHGWSDYQAALTDLGWDVLAFFADRLKVLLRDQGQRHDLVDAVFALGDDDLVRIVRRVEALGAFLETDDGANLLAGYKRASNILKAEAKKGDLPTGMVQTGLPNQPEQEVALAFAVGAARTAVDKALEAEDFAAAMTALAHLRAPVDAFFDKVMVNSDVPAERENRLKLLGQVREVMDRVAVFGKIAG